MSEGEVVADLVRRRGTSGLEGGCGNSKRRLCGYLGKRRLLRTGEEITRRKIIGKCSGEERVETWKKS